MAVGSTRKNTSITGTKFLDNLDVDFALRMREEDRLSGFRRELWAAWDGIEQMDDEQVAIKEFTDRLVKAKKETEGEWLEIRADLLIGADRRLARLSRLV